MEWLYFIIGLIVSIILLFINYSYAFGVLLALGALLILKYLRLAFNKRLMKVETFSSGLFIGYMVIVFVLMFIPLGIAFLFPEVINPYFLAGAIFLERIYMFIEKAIFSKKGRLNV